MNYDKLPNGKSKELKREAGKSLIVEDPIDARIAEVQAQIHAVQQVLKSKGPLLHTLERAHDKGATCCGGTHAHLPPGDTSHDREHQLQVLQDLLATLAQDKINAEK